jgi:hypothetical protein
MKRRIICLVDEDETAQGLVQKLTKRGILESELFVLGSQPGDTQAADLQDQAECAKADASAGEQVGLMAGIGPALIGAVGPFLAADNITHGVGGGDIRASRQEAFRLVDRFGLSDETAEKYKNELAKGGILIAVQVNPEIGPVIRRIFEEAHCHEITEE